MGHARHVAQEHEGRLGVGGQSGDACSQGCSHALGVIGGVYDPNVRVESQRRGAHRRGVGAGHHHDPGDGRGAGGAQGGMEQRRATPVRQQLAAAEPRGRTSGQHHRLKGHPPFRAPCPHASGSPIFTVR